MDMVYLLGFGSAWKNNEIRFSLRSVVKHVPDVQNIYIVGECPRFLKGPGLIHVLHPDETNFVSINTKQKLLRACRIPELSESFALMNDDFFFLKETRVTNYPYYFRGDLKTGLANHEKRQGPYYKSISNTIKELKRGGFRTLHFGMHRPAVINKRFFPDIMRWFNWDYRFGLLTRSLYCNALRLPKIQEHDLKINLCEDREKFFQRIEGKHIFSIGDSAISKTFIDIMNELYPEKTKWETD